jgi:hypothetical protein
MLTIVLHKLAAAFFALKLHPLSSSSLLFPSFSSFAPLVQFNEPSSFSQMTVREIKREERNRKKKRKGWNKNCDARCKWQAISLLPGEHGLSLSSSCSLLLSNPLTVISLFPCLPFNIR